MSIVLLFAEAYTADGANDSAYIWGIDIKMICQNANFFGILSNYINDMLGKFRTYEIIAMFSSHFPSLYSIFTKYDVILSPKNMLFLKSFSSACFSGIVLDHNIFIFFSLFSSVRVSNIWLLLKSHGAWKFDKFETLLYIPFICIKINWKHWKCFLWL